MVKIKIYTIPTSEWCDKLKKWLDNNNYSYQEVDVEDNEKAREEMVNETGQMAVPVTRIEDEFVIGFNQDKIDEIIKKKKRELTNQS
jgi:glutaredoxin 3